MRVVFSIAAAVTLLAPGIALSHGGGLNAEGCHNDRKNGGYHCHRGGGGDSTPRIRQVYTPPPKPGPNRDTVRQVQTLLTELNYKPGPSDGVPGRATKQAIADFDNQYIGYIDTGDYDDVLSALQKTKRKQDEETKRQITGNTASGGNEGGIAGWILGLIAVLGAYLLGKRNRKP